MPVPGAERKPTKILQLVNCLGLGGTERQLVEVLRGLDRTRFDSDLCVLMRVGELVPTMRALGFAPTEFHLKGSLARPNTAVQVLRLALRIREERARLVHCHDFYSNLVGSAAARLAGVPYIVSRRDLGAWIGPARAQVLRLATRLAPTVLCNAQAIRDSLVDVEGNDPERIVVVPNGLDLELFDREAARPLEAPVKVLAGPGPVVAVVGNMKHAVKGHTDLLLAAHAVLSTAPECRFVLVGDGELRAELEQRARELGIAHAVEFAGRRTDVPAILSRCQLAVSASHREGLSNALMEAMAARLPVVATGVGGNVELVRDGRSGFIVPRADPAALAQRIVELVRAPHLARRLGLAGRRHIEEELSASRLTQRLETLYERLIGHPGEVRRAA